MLTQRVVAIAPAFVPREPPRLSLTASRYVTIELAAALTGLTEKAIRRKIEREVWLEGRHWHKRDGGILIDMKEYEKWAETGKV